MSSNIIIQMIFFFKCFKVELRIPCLSKIGQKSNKHARKCYETLLNVSLGNELEIET